MARHRIHNPRCTIPHRPRRDGIPRHPRTIPPPTEGDVRGSDGGSVAGWTDGDWGVGVVWGFGVSGYWRAGGGGVWGRGC